MLNLLLTTAGKTLSKAVRILNLGNGSTWPGHIALSVNKDFIRQTLSGSKIRTIFIAGTNGKTTTALLISTALEKSGFKVLHNESGANLLNGIASTLILNSNATGKLPYDFAIFEVDENSLPLLLKQHSPDFLVLLNLFRDQLDRYGEVNTIAGKWKEALRKLDDSTKLILNSDDPLIASLGIDKKTRIHSAFYFGLNKASEEKTVSQAADSVYCPSCGTRLDYDYVTFSHLGDWHCPKCSLARIKPDLDSFSYPLPGVYNRYNTLAAALLLKKAGIGKKEAEEGFRDFKPAFGRQEVIVYKNRKVQLFLSKNPTSFNQSYSTIKDMGAENILFVLNDRIPDGRDISWIWDADLPGISKFENVLISGDRVYDMALRVKYEGKEFRAFENLKEAIDSGIEVLKENETLFILPTYSAMLEARKILTGKKIL